MAIVSSLWNTLVGKQNTSHSKEPRPLARAKTAVPLSGNHNPVHLEKRKLVATRSQLESQSNSKLDLQHLRARIDSESRQYAEMRERQQTSISRWFGERASGIDEAALTKRLAAPSPRLSQDELELSLNFSDIHLPDYYQSDVICLGTSSESPLPSGFAVDCSEELEVLAGGEVFAGSDVFAGSEVIACNEWHNDISDSADFSDMAADFADFADLVLMPPLVALTENVPELDDLLARLQIVEWLEAQEAEAKEAAEQDEQDQEQQDQVREYHADLHIVTPFETCLQPEENKPVPMIKGQGKGKKGRRARGKEAAKIKNGTRD
ncbi:hypothetical protein BH11CYA1_BH11CYA1_03310 [soil metagenome]